MTCLVFKLDSLIADPQLGRYGPLEFVRNPDNSSPLHAAYLHGRDYHVGMPSEGNPLVDLSGHGRTLTQVGADLGTSEGTQAKGFLGSIFKRLETPFTADQLAAAGAPNEMHILSFLRSPITPAGSANFRPFTATVGSAGQSRRIILTTDNTYNASAIAWDDTQNRASVQGNPPPAWRDTDFYMAGGYVTLAGVGSVTAHAGGAVSDIFQAWLATTGVRQIGGSAFWLGDSANGVYSKTLVATLFFNRRLSIAEQQTIYDEMRLLLADYGIAV